MVIPVGLPYYHQELMLLEKDETGEISTKDVLGVVFVPLTGNPARGGDRE
jgi:protein-L-isoaspartate(D-aspartate) O-methyltransferase